MANAGGGGHQLWAGDSAGGGTSTEDGKYRTRAIGYTNNNRTVMRVDLFL